MAATVHAISSLPYELNSGVYYYFSTSLVGRNVSWWGFDSDSHTISKVDLTITDYLGSGSYYLYCVASTTSAGIRVRLIKVSSTSTTSGTTIGQYIIQDASSYYPTSEIALESAYTLYLQSPSLSYNLIRSEISYVLSKPVLSYSLSRSKVITPLTSPVISSYELKRLGTLKEPIIDTYNITRSKDSSPLVGPTLNGSITINTLTTKEINFYQNNSSNNTLDKDLTEILQLDGNFREEVNIINPLFTIEYDKVPNFNYCYIPDFGRYYYIQSITNIITNVWELDCSVDVLMSYKNQILKLECFVDRNEFTFNNDIIDENRCYVSGYQMEDIVLDTDFFDLGDYTNPTAPRYLVVGCSIAALRKRED